MKFLKWYNKNTWSFFKNIKLPYRIILMSFQLIVLINLLAFGFSVVCLEYETQKTLIIFFLVFLGIDVLLNVLYYIFFVKRNIAPLAIGLNNEPATTLDLSPTSISPECTGISLNESSQNKRQGGDE